MTIKTGTSKKLACFCIPYIFSTYRKRDSFFCYHFRYFFHFDVSIMNITSFYWTILIIRDTLGKGGCESVTKWHMEEDGVKRNVTCYFLSKKVKKVSRIIWMAPKLPASLILNMQKIEIHTPNFIHLKHLVIILSTLLH